MKKLMKVMIMYCMLLSVQVNAKGQSGIYKTAADYSNNKTVQTTGKHTHIKLHNFFGNTPYITVVADGQKHRLKKDELYGYRNSHNEVYRFYKNKEYKIEEAGNIFIYTTQQNITQGKGYIVINNYYFSKGAAAPIHNLSLDELKNAYRSNEQFYELLCLLNDRTDLREYDATHNTFRINHLYSKANK